MKVKDKIKMGMMIPQAANEEKAKEMLSLLKESMRLTALDSISHLRKAKILSMKFIVREPKEAIAPLLTGTFKWEADVEPPKPLRTVEEDEVGEGKEFEEVDEQESTD